MFWNKSEHKKCRLALIFCPFLLDNYFQIKRGAEKKSKIYSSLRLLYSSHLLFYNLSLKNLGENLKQMVILEYKWKITKLFSSCDNQQSAFLQTLQLFNLLITYNFRDTSYHHGSFLQRKIKQLFNVTKLF